MASFIESKLLYQGHMLWILKIKDLQNVSMTVMTNMLTVTMNIVKPQERKNLPMKIKINQVITFVNAEM